MIQEIKHLEVKEFLLINKNDIVAFLKEKAEEYGSKSLLKIYASMYEKNADVLQEVFLEALQQFENNIIDGYLTFDTILCRLKKIEKTNLLEVTTSNTEIDNLTLNETKVYIEVTLSKSITDFIPKSPERQEIKNIDQYSYTLFSKAEGELLETKISTVEKNVYILKEVNTASINNIKFTESTIKEELLKEALNEEESLPEFEIKIGVDYISLLAIQELKKCNIKIKEKNLVNIKPEGSKNFYLPDEIPQEFQIHYCDLMDYIFNSMHNLAPYLEKELKTNDLTKEMLQYCLPLSAYSSIIIIIESTKIKELIYKLINSIYIEVKELGESIKQECLKEYPGIFNEKNLSVTYNEYLYIENEKQKKEFLDLYYTCNYKKQLETIQDKLYKRNKEKNYVELLNFSYQEFQIKLAAKILYQSSYGSLYFLEDLLKNKVSTNFRKGIIDNYLSKKNNQDNYLYDTLENFNMQIEGTTSILNLILLSQYSKKELIQNYTIETNYTWHSLMEKMPEEVSQIYCNLMFYVKEFFKSLTEKLGLIPEYALYCLPVAFKVNFLWNITLKELIFMLQDLKIKEAELEEFRKKLREEIISKIPSIENLFNI